MGTHLVEVEGKGEGEGEGAQVNQQCSSLTSPKHQTHHASWGSGSGVKTVPLLIEYMARKYVGAVWMA